MRVNRGITMALGGGPLALDGAPTLRGGGMPSPNRLRSKSLLFYLPVRRLVIFSDFPLFYRRSRRHHSRRKLRENDPECFALSQAERQETKTVCLVATSTILSLIDFILRALLSVEAKKLPVPVSDAKISNPAMSVETPREEETLREEGAKKNAVISGPATLAETLLESRDTLLYAAVLQEQISSATRAQRTYLESLKRRIDEERDGIFATNATNWLKILEFNLPVDVGGSDSGEGILKGLHQSVENLMYVPHSC